MMNGDNLEYIQAYTEIFCLLKYFPIEYINKLPNKLLEMIKNKSNKKYNINIDLKKDLKSQNITKKTKDILMVLTYNYWSNEQEKAYLEKRFYENEKKCQKELSEKYNIENIFKDEKIYEENKSDEIISIIEYKENYFLRLFNKIKSFFKK